MAGLSGRYWITSNRESGLGRYDVMMELLDKTQRAAVMEFKVHDPVREKGLEETLANALAQIREKQYDTELIARGCPKNRYGIMGLRLKEKSADRVKKDMKNRGYAEKSTVFLCAKKKKSVPKSVLFGTPSKIPGLSGKPPRIIAFSRKMC